MFAIRGMKFFLIYAFEQSKTNLKIFIRFKILLKAVLKYPLTEAKHNYVLLKIIF